jgi:hypothetical protein
MFLPLENAYLGNVTRFFSNPKRLSKGLEEKRGFA